MQDSYDDTASYMIRVRLLRQEPEQLVIRQLAKIDSAR